MVPGELLAPREEARRKEGLRNICSSTQTSAPHLPQLTKKGQREGMKRRYKACAHSLFS